MLSEGIRGEVNTLYSNNIHYYPWAVGTASPARPWKPVRIATPFPVPGQDCHVTGQLILL